MCRNRLQIKWNTLKWNDAEKERKEGRPKKKNKTTRSQIFIEPNQFFVVVVVVNELILILFRLTYEFLPKKKNNNNFDRFTLPLMKCKKWYLFKWLRCKTSFFSRTENFVDRFNEILPLNEKAYTIFDCIDSNKYRPKSFYQNANKKKKNYI